MDTLDVGAVRGPRINDEYKKVLIPLLLYGYHRLQKQICRKCECCNTSLPDRDDWHGLLRCDNIPPSSDTGWKELVDMTRQWMYALGDPNTGEQCSPIESGYANFEYKFGYDGAMGIFTQVYPIAAFDTELMFRGFRKTERTS